jgi:hypothetical protein
MNKSCGSNLRFNSQLNGKITNPPLMTLCVGKSYYKAECFQPIAVCKVKLNYFHIFVHSYYQKNN